jgi:hypothetical protein
MKNPISIFSILTGNIIGKQITADLSATFTVYSQGLARD